MAAYDSPEYAATLCIILHYAPIPHGHRAQKALKSASFTEITKGMRRITHIQQRLQTLGASDLGVLDPCERPSLCRTDLHMTKPLTDALIAKGYDTLTDVQNAVTAPGLDASDLLVSAQTGSGKTVAFGLAIGPTLLADDDTLPQADTPLALVIAPTRELAFQVKRELSWLYAGTGARVASCVGGMDMRDERRTLARGAHIVVGTPGRLRDHIQRESLDMSTLRAIVLDEADEMLDLGFREDLEFMLGEAPEDRRTLMFSATVPPMIETLARSYQRDAVRITTSAGKSQHADITYQALRVAHGDAENALINVLRYHEAQSAIVFANTRLAVSRLAARFANRGFAVVSLSGELSQSERSHALQAMRDGRARVCVATDVAARGIDLPNLDLVIHAELPTNSEALLHRSGRTGRAGRKGTSALIVPPRSAKKAERLLRFSKIKAEWTEAPSADEILRRDEERLLSDPAWDEEITADETDFATKLLDRFSPETIAAGYLRLHRSRYSAPEVLSEPDAPTPRKEHASFGPSQWVSLSVGRSDRAEPRWLLPLLCNAGGLSKEDIGAIRVQDKDTHVEVRQASFAGLMAKLDEKGVLEQGIAITAMDRAPEHGPGSSRPPRGKPKPGADRPYKSRHEGKDGLMGRSSSKPKPANASFKKSYSGGPDIAADNRKPRHAPDRPANKPYAKTNDKPSSVTKDAPQGKPAAKYGKPSDDRARSKPSEKGDAKPYGKPSGKSGSKSFGKPSGKPGSKPYGKPSGKPTATSVDGAPPKPKGKTSGKPRASALADPSKRVSRSGKAAPHRGARTGGDMPPKRRKTRD